MSSTGTLVLDQVGPPGMGLHALEHAPPTPRQSQGPWVSTNLHPVSGAFQQKGRMVLVSKQPRYHSFVAFGLGGVSVCMRF
mmetsp:Transcript_57825/g.94963  ORF Transcript_57825/g.94963 Transcript_57825/m.94963 type:complete len:81 (+) Transcript_57825:283-525(+)